MIPSTKRSQLVNALTIDVEDYFHVSALAPYVPRQQWNTRECRIEGSIDRLLAMLSDAQVKATFFTLGWVGEHYPSVVQKIVRERHELASHGFGHHRVHEQSRAFFAADIKLAKLVLEDVGGVEVKGYRAPSFSIDSRNLWAFECIEHAGYRYSSSVYPVVHDHYGMPEAPRVPHRVGDGLVEIPVATARAAGRNWPAGGGGYFRLLPYVLSRSMIGWMNRRDGMPAVFYFHPWEIDHEQPRVHGLDARARFRHYVNLRHMETKLRRLFGDFAWGRIDEVFADTLLPASTLATAASPSITSGGAFAPLTSG
jgi:polysaccharide deacetylase family protein (PEP-CTERM system associated)